MDTSQDQLLQQSQDQIYLEIWKIEQAHTRSRWTLTTFFISVSFAILGFSFQEQFTSPKALALRLVALILYWLAILMFRRTFSYNRVLRAYLVEMEQTGRSSLDIQGRANKSLYSTYYKQPTTFHILVGVGIFYMIAIILLLLLHL